MLVSHGQIVVVDDQRKEGEAVVRAAWAEGIPALFALHSPEIWARDDNPYKGLRGIRVVFTDIDLLGGGMVGNDSQLFSPVEKALDTLLHEKNGPYALVAWTSFDQHADGLREHLAKRLPECKRPLVFRCLAKDKFKEGNSGNLREAIASLLDEDSSLRAVAQWESDVVHAAAEVASDLTTTASTAVSGESTIESCLAVLMYDLASASVGKRNEPAVVAQGLYTVLGALVADRLSSSSPLNLDLPRPTGDVEEYRSSWAIRVNSMLHLDQSAVHSGPGLLIEYPLALQADLALPTLSTTKMCKFARGQFFNPDADMTKAEKRDAASRVKLVLMDISPPCDHAQDKVTWRRFIAGVLVPEDFWKFLWLRDEEDNPRFGEPAGKYLWPSPAMEFHGEGVVLILNGRLVTSIPDTIVKSAWQDLAVVARVREQLFVDFLGWLGRHTTRVGHTSA